MIRDITLYFLWYGYGCYLVEMLLPSLRPSPSTLYSGRYSRSSSIDEVRKTESPQRPLGNATQCGDQFKMMT